MEIHKQPNSFHLLKLAFHSARFSGKRIFIILSLLSLFVAGSLYITNRLYKHNPAPADKMESNKDTASPNDASKPTKADNKSEPKLKPIPLSIEYWEKRKQNGINQLNSQLHASAVREARRGTRPRVWIDEKVEERLARHKSVLTEPDEVAAIQQDQLVFSERDHQDDIPPPPEPEPGFWSEFKKDFIAALKDMLEIII